MYRQSNIKLSGISISILFCILTNFSNEVLAYDFTQSRLSIINEAGRNVESSRPLGRRVYRLGVDYSLMKTKEDHTLISPQDAQVISIGGAYGIGIHDTLTVGINTFSTNSIMPEMKSRGIGDLEVGYYHRLNSAGLRSSWSFGLVATLPTSDNPHYFGGSHASFKAPIVFTKNTYGKKINLQLTPTYRQNDLIGDYPVSSGIGWGANLGLNILPKVSVFAEANGEYGLEKETLNSYGQVSFGISTGGVNSDWFIKAGATQDIYRNSTQRQTKLFISLNFDMNKTTKIDKKELALDCFPSIPENIVLNWPELPEKIFVLNFDKVHFDTDKHNIKPEYYAILDKVITILEEHTEIKKLKITGHTDLRMTYDYNVALSQRRSNSVYQYLIDSGIDPNRLEIEFMSYIHPNDDKITTEGLAANRRVEFQVIEVSDKGLRIDRNYRTKRDYGKQN